MRLSEFIRIVKDKQIHPDPDIRIVGPGGFLSIHEVNSRSDYHDDHPAFSGEYEKDDFICIEVNNI